MLYIGMFLLIIPQALCNVIVADHTMSRMIELTTKSPYCILHSDRGVIQKMVLGSDPNKLRMLSNGAVTALEKSCRDKSLIATHHDGFIFPGTKWCGPGNRSASYKELGFHFAEDKCCREHDHCPAALAPGECRRSVCNKGRFTRSHCDCDARFRRCLQALNTEIANTLGAIFFNIIQVTCFKERRPCSQWQRNGYSEEESKVLCSQWKFRPSEKYVPLMPMPTLYS
ncbi:acidic phospholipase A2 PA4-like isoform X1 [Arctopsyche grandis]